MVNLRFSNYFVSLRAFCVVCVVYHSGHQNQHIWTTPGLDAEDLKRRRLDTVSGYSLLHSSTHGAGAGELYHYTSGHPSLSLLMPDEHQGASTYQGKEELIFLREFPA